MDMTIEELCVFILKTVTVDTEWPDDAVYCVRYSVKCWPTEATQHTAYFKDLQELKAWYERKLEWATLEDNYFDAFTLLKWDLGPELESVDLDRYVRNINLKGK